MINKTDEENSDDSPIRPNSLFKLKSWGDVFAVMSLFAMLIAGLAWGLKLESRNDALQIRVEAVERARIMLEAQISQGILPVTKERLDAIQARDVMMLERITNLERDCYNHSIVTHDKP